MCVPKEQGVTIVGTVSNLLRRSGPRTQVNLFDRKLFGKPVWDWLDLSSKLLIPIVVLAATIGFGWWQAHLADQQYQDNVLETYIGNMQDLVNHNLDTSQPDAEIRQVAREQTLTTLRRLNAQHNGIVLQFLHDAHLIGMQGAAIDLSNADLSYDDLSGAHLTSIDLSGADLSHADLSHADLSGATMY